MPGNIFTTPIVNGNTAVGRAAAHALGVSTSGRTHFVDELDRLGDLPPETLELVRAAVEEWEK